MDGCEGGMVFDLLGLVLRRRSRGEAMKKGENDDERTWKTNITPFTRDVNISS
jgi:hypothetical protein